MKKILFTLTILLTSATCLANEFADHVFPYFTTMGHTWFAAPVGASMGFGARLKKDILGADVSVQLSRFAGLRPIISVKGSFLFYVHDNSYVGLRGTTGLFMEKLTNFTDWTRFYNMDLILYGREFLDSKGKKEFFHISAHKNGISLDYGWEL